MLGKKTFHSAQGEKLHTIHGSDIVVIAQVDKTALEGYRTVNTTISLTTDTLIKQIKAEGSAGIIQVLPDSGLTGKGTTADPLEADNDYFTANWATNQYINVSQIGNLTQSTLPFTKGTNYTLTVSSDIPVYLGGLNLTFPKQNINIKSHVASPDSKKLYVYFTLVDGQIRVVISETARAERFDSTYVATIVMGTGGTISSITSKPFTRIDKYRFSESVQGSSIPVSDGGPWENGYTQWGGVGTLDAINAGIDTTQKEGQVTFDKDTETVRIVQDGKFFVKDLDIALALIGPYMHVMSSGGVNGAMGYLNGVNIWKGKGTSYAVMDYSKWIREGWNTVHMEWGELRLQGPFLK